MTGTEDLAFWKAAARSSPDGLIIADHAGIIHFASDRVQGLLGWTPEELTGKPVEVLIPEALRSGHHGKRDAYRANPAPRMMGVGRELSALAKDGKLLEMEVALSPMPLPGGFFVLASIRALSHQRRLEKAFQSIFKATAASTGTDFISTLVSALGATTGVDCALLTVRMSGADDRLRTLAFWQKGRLIEPFDYPIADAPCELVIKGEDVIILERVQESFPSDHDLIRLGAQAYIGVPLLAASAEVLGNLVLLHESALPDGADLLPALKLFAMRAASSSSASRRGNSPTDEGLLPVRETAAIGQLAAGWLRDQQLWAILGFAQPSPSDQEGDPSFCPAEHRARSPALQSPSHQPLAFPVRTASFQVFELGKPWGPLLVEAQARIRSVILRREGDGAGLRVQGDLNQIQQVIINLCSNAIDAMPGGGTLSVGAAPSADKPGFAELRVADTGSGIPEDIRSKIFEPFFTTKEAGKGTGLGLALVAEIVARHNGTIACESELGKGTTFRVTLPPAS